jgi:hypothetical protein
MITQRLPGTGGHNHQGMPPLEQMIDDRSLLTTKLAVAEIVVENLVGTAHWRDAANDIHHGLISLLIKCPNDFFNGL